MSNKFNTRIQNKYDTLANWNNSDFDLLSGEVAVAINDNYTRVKIGDGRKSFSEIQDVFIPERAVSAMFNEHATDDSMHVSQSERSTWNTVSNKADLTALNNYLSKSGGDITGDIDFEEPGTGLHFMSETGGNHLYFECPAENNDDGLIFGMNGPEAIKFNYDTTPKTLQSYLDETCTIDRIATSTTNTINVVPGTKIYQYTVSNSNLITLGGIASNWTDSTKALNVELWIKVPTSGTTVSLPAEPTWYWLETPDLTTTMPNQILYVAVRVTSTKTFANLYFTGA